MTTFRDHLRLHFSPLRSASDIRETRDDASDFALLDDLDDEDVSSCLAEIKDKLERRRAAHPLD